MLRILQIKKETHTLGLRVSKLVNSLKECETLGTFESNFKRELTDIKTGNHLKADTQYKTRIADQFTPAELVQIVKYHATLGDQIIYIITK